MRTNLILFTLLFLASCGDGKVTTAKEYGNDIVKYEDIENKVICYSIAGYSHGGLFCVKKD